MTTAITSTRHDLRFWVSTTATSAGLVAAFSACVYILGIGAQQAIVEPPPVAIVSVKQSAIAPAPEPPPAFAEFIGFQIGDKIMSCTELMSNPEVWYGLSVGDQVMVVRMCENNHG